MTILEMKNINFTVDDKKILKDISFKIEKGEHTSIIGPSGSGKSTILMILGMLTPETGGQVLYNGEDIDTLEPTKYRQKVSYAFQTPRLFGQSIRDNLSYPAYLKDEDFDEKKARDYMDQVDLDHLDIDEDISGLSGGERQRVALVRNFMATPDVILLDEISSSLDKDTAKKVWKFVLELAEKNHITLIWVSHNEEEQNMADHRIWINDGKIEKEKYNG